MSHLSAMGLTQAAGKQVIEASMKERILEGHNLKNVRRSRMESQHSREEGVEGPGANLKPQAWADTEQPKAMIQDHVQIGGYRIRL